MFFLKYWTFLFNFFVTRLDIYVTSPRHSMTTRFLLTCICSIFFCGDRTLDDLHDAILQDATALYTTGLDAVGMTLAISFFPLPNPRRNGCVWIDRALNFLK